MSAITYERLPLAAPPEQTTNQATQRRSIGKLLNLSQDKFLIGLGKLMAFQGVGFIISGMLSEISSQGDIARDLNLDLTDTYYVTCTQATNAFAFTLLSTSIYTLCVFGYFVKNNREKHNENISPKMQIALQHRIRDEIHAQLEKRTVPSTDP